MSAPARFDAVIHAPHRLAICAALSTATRMAFADLARSTELADHTLSKQLRYLVEAGYASTAPERDRHGHRTVSVALTPAGRRAYAGHAAALRELIGEA